MPITVGSPVQAAIQAEDETQAALDAKRMDDASASFYKMARAQAEVGRRFREIERLFEAHDAKVSAQEAQAA